MFDILVSFAISEISGKWLKKIGQSSTLLPFFISWVVVSAMFFNMFNYDSGVLNNILSTFGQEPVDVYSKTSSWPLYLLFLNSWKYFGYGTIVYLAGLANIDKTLYESAYIDGANVFQRIRKITFPLLVPTITINLLLRVGTLMKANFDMFYQMVSNNPYISDRLDIIETFTFRALTKGGTSSDIGIATAAGLYQALFGLVLILIANKLVKHYSAENAVF